jgi:ABC-type Fe3+-hydroxamate transport system substrate-binding protein
MPPIHRLFMLLLLAVTMILTACGGAAPAAPSVADAVPTAPRVPPTTIPPTIVPNEASDPAAGSPSAIPSAQPTALGADCQMVKHVAGETAVCGQPQKVVVLGAQLLDVVVALGGSARRVRGVAARRIQGITWCRYSLYR